MNKLIKEYNNDQGDFIEEDDIIVPTPESRNLDFARVESPLYKILHDPLRKVQCYTITLNSRYYVHNIEEQYMILWNHITECLLGASYYFTFELTKKDNVHAHGIIEQEHSMPFNNRLIKIGHINTKRCYQKYNWFLYMFKNMDHRCPPITTIH